MRLVMVIDQRDGAGDFAGVEFLAVLDQLGADHVGDGQRAVVVALLAGHLVQLFEQRGRQGNAEAGGGFFFMPLIICNWRGNASGQLPWFKGLASRFRSNTFFSL